MQVADVNDFMKIYKYFPNISEDKTRKDLFFRYKDPNKKIEKSVVSLNIFLNDNFFEGGTYFCDDDYKLIKSILPKVGKVIIFDCNQLYSENFVTSGAPKYILKTEILVYKQYPELIPKVQPTAPLMETSTLPIDNPLNINVAQQMQRGITPIQPINNMQPIYPNYSNYNFPNYHYFTVFF